MKNPISMPIGSTVILKETNKQYYIEKSSLKNSKISYALIGSTRFGTEKTDFAWFDNEDLIFVCYPTKYHLKDLIMCCNGDDDEYSASAGYGGWGPDE